jgi:hypothetical protein
MRERGAAAAVPRAARESLPAHAAALPRQGAADHSARARQAASGLVEDGASRTLRRTLLLIQDQLRQGSLAATNLSVQLSEHGLDVVVRADRLSREEKGRLRQEIAAIVAASGHSLAGLTFNGTSAAHDREEQF